MAEPYEISREAALNARGFRSTRNRRAAANIAQTLGAGGEVFHAGTDAATALAKRALPSDQMTRREKLAAMQEVVPQYAAAELGVTNASIRTQEAADAYETKMAQIQAQLDADIARTEMQARTANAREATDRLRVAFDITKEKDKRLRELDDGGRAFARDVNDAILGVAGKEYEDAREKALISLTGASDQPAITDADGNQFPAMSAAEHAQMLLADMRADAQSQLLDRAENMALEQATRSIADSPDKQRLLGAELDGVYRQHDAISPEQRDLGRRLALAGTKMPSEVFESIVAGSEAGKVADGDRLTYKAAEADIQAGLTENNSELHQVLGVVDPAQAWSGDIRKRTNDRLQDLSQMESSFVGQAPAPEEGAALVARELAQGKPAAGLSNAEKLQGADTMIEGAVGEATGRVLPGGIQETLPTEQPKTPEQIQYEQDLERVIPHINALPQDSLGRFVGILDTIETMPELGPVQEMKQRILDSPDFAAYMQARGYQDPKFAFREYQRETKAKMKQITSEDEERRRQNERAGVAPPAKVARPMRRQATRQALERGISPTPAPPPQSPEPIKP